MSTHILPCGAVIELESTWLMVSERRCRAIDFIPPVGQTDPPLPVLDMAYECTTEHRHDSPALDSILRAGVDLDPNTGDSWILMAVPIGRLADNTYHSVPVIFDTESKSKVWLRLAGLDPVRTGVFEAMTEVVGLYAWESGIGGIRSRLLNAIEDLTDVVSRNADGQIYCRSGGDDFDHLKLRETYRQALHQPRPDVRAMELYVATHHGLCPTCYQSVRSIAAPQPWGFSARPLPLSSSKSHTRGAAIDINTPSSSFMTPISSGMTPVSSTTTSAVPSVETAASPAAVPPETPEPRGVIWHGYNRPLAEVAELKDGHFWIRRRGQYGVESQYFQFRVDKWIPYGDPLQFWLPPDPATERRWERADGARFAYSHLGRWIEMVPPTDLS